MNTTTLNMTTLDGGVIIKKGGGATSVASLMTEVTWQQLKDLRDSGKLVAGMKYRMIDYDTYTSQEGTESAMHPFDLILTALDNKTLSEECSAIHSARDVDGYFANMDLSAWELKYTIDNDTSRFSWAVAPSKTIVVDLVALGLGEVSGKYVGTSEIEGVMAYMWEMIVSGEVAYILTQTDSPSIGDMGLLYIEGFGVLLETPIISTNTTTLVGKGVIYRMLDEHYNECPYDFKNILFTRKLTDGTLDNENGVDTLVYTFDCNTNGVHIDYSNSCKNNYMDFCSILPNNVILLYPGFVCFGNKFGYMSSDNTFSNYKDSNFENSCSLNVFGDYCIKNTFGTKCSRNTLASNCSNNIFGENCTDNTLGNNCDGNTFGGYCYRNTLGDYCSKNIFGDSHNVFHAVSLIFAPNTIYVRLVNAETAAMNYNIQNYRIDLPRTSYVSDNPYKEIQVLRDRKCTTYVTWDNKVNIVEYTVDDIKNV